MKRPTKLSTEQIRIEEDRIGIHAIALDVRGWETRAWSQDCPWDAAARCVGHLIARREMAAKVATETMV